jgi:hypothetical protein
VDGAVTSDESDKYALYKHMDTLDALCRKCRVTLFSASCDSTDLRFNIDDIELPDGMETTDELMAQTGVWIEAQSAVRMIEALLSSIESEKTRFGLLRNHHDDVVAELEESLKFAKAAVAKMAKFNFSIVM